MSDINTPNEFPPPPPPPPVTRKRRVLPAIVGGLFVAVVLGTAIAVAGDDGNEASRSVGEPAVTTEATDTTEGNTPPAVEEPTTTTTEPEGPGAIGPNEWFTWENGLAAQVTSVAEFTPDYDTTSTPDVVATVTVRNGTGQVFDAAMMTVNLYGGPNGVQAEGEYTFYGFDGDVPASGTATAKWSFTLPAEHFGQITVEVAPGYDADYAEYDSAFYAGSVS